jgi:hypothetical protein
MPGSVSVSVANVGFTGFRGAVGIENREIASDLNPHLRFFVFEQEPNMERLTPVAPETALSICRSNRRRASTSITTGASAGDACWRGA